MRRGTGFGAYMAVGPVKSRRTYISLMDERDTVDSGIRSGIVKLLGSPLFAPSRARARAHLFALAKSAADGNTDEVSLARSVSQR